MIRRRRNRWIIDLNWKLFASVTWSMVVYSTKLQQSVWIWHSKNGWRIKSFLLFVKMVTEKLVFMENLLYYLCCVEIKQTVESPLISSYKIFNNKVKVWISDWKLGNSSVTVGQIQSQPRWNSLQLARQWSTNILGVFQIEIHKLVWFNNERNHSGKK